MFTGQSGWCSRIFVYISVKVSKLSAEASSLKSLSILTLLSTFWSKYITWDFKKYKNHYREREKKKEKRETFIFVVVKLGNLNCSFIMKFMLSKNSK